MPSSDALQATPKIIFAMQDYFSNTLFNMCKVGVSITTILKTGLRQVYIKKQILQIYRLLADRPTPTPTQPS